MIHIYRATRGKYGKPIPVPESGMKWIDDQGSEIEPPLKQPCEHPKHWQWGRGTRNGQCLYFATDAMFLQKWEMTKREQREAVKQYDMASLEMPPRLLCPDCSVLEQKPKCRLCGKPLNWPGYCDSNCAEQAA